MSSSNDSSQSSEGENVEQSAQNIGPKRQKRQKKHGTRMAFVTMPTGYKVSITIPTPAKCDCKKPAKTTLIPLRVDGTMGAREFKVVSAQMADTNKKHHIQYSKYEIIKIYKIKNCCLYNRYRNMQRELAKRTGYVNEKLLFHGSPSMSDIIATGFDERHSSIDGFFGAGIYFADDSSKSNEYAFRSERGQTSQGCPKHKDPSCFLCERRMLLCRVSLGKMYTSTKSDKMAHPPPGYDSVKGDPTVLSGMQHAEYVIYRGEQAYPEYSIFYKIVK